VNWTTCGRH